MKNRKLFRNLRLIGFGFDCFLLDISLYPVLTSNTVKLPGFASADTCWMRNEPVTSNIFSAVNSRGHTTVNIHSSTLRNISLIVLKHTKRFHNAKRGKIRLSTTSVCCLLAK